MTISIVVAKIALELTVRVRVEVRVRVRASAMFFKLYRLNCFARQLTEVVLNKIILHHCKT
jgi:hypothetical protein